MLEGTSQLVRWQRIEGVLVFLSALAIYSVLESGYSWWVAVLIFFLPDVSFAMYALGSRIGAIGYNIVHVYAFGAVTLACGMVLQHEMLASLGALWLSHSGFDRMFGYGLKSPEGFNVTHLGKIGKISDR